MEGQQYGLNAAAYTLGCKVNQYDTEALLNRLSENGFHIKDFNQQADLYIINTCTVTHIGDRKSRQMIRRARKTNPRAKIAVCGCLAKLEPYMLREAGADFIFSAKDSESLLNWVNTGIIKASAVQPGEGSAVSTPTVIPRTRAYVKIQEGCDRFCAYCIVPYARGPVVSRPPESVLAEARSLILHGAKEIVLTGIHAASYGKDLTEAFCAFPGLIEQAASLEGLYRLRLGSVEPYAIDDAFIDVVKTRPVLCDHFHLSLQSGCDSTLKRMNRRYTAAEYARAAERLLKARPDAALTTDIIVGFPGETDAHFEESLRFVGEMGFLRTHVFEYSARKGTPAARFPDQIPQPVKNERGQRMRTLAAEMEHRFLNIHTGREARVPVLFESRCGSDQPSETPLWEGHTTNYMTVRARGYDLLNAMATIRLETVRDGVIYGSIV